MKLKCLYCENKLEPDYKEFEQVAKFISDRGKIVGREKSGVCARHQRRLAKAIKYDRHLALLPFVS